MSKQAERNRAKTRIQTALDECVEHWEHMRDNGISDEHSPNADCCALCDLFASYKDDPCVGCPVAVKAHPGDSWKQGDHACKSTSYTDARAFLIGLPYGKEGDVQNMIDELKALRDVGPADQSIDVLIALGEDT